VLLLTKTVLGSKFPYENFRRLQLLQRSGRCCTGRNIGSNAQQLM